MNRFKITTFPLQNKTILLRADLDVPIENNKITDSSRIIAALPTINYLLNQNCKIILIGHLGRPEGKIVPALSTKVIYNELKLLLPEIKIFFLSDCLGKEIKEKIDRGKPGEIFILENLRFYKEEQENDPAFAHSLANLAEVYINDAFANSHRQHASIDKITDYLPSLAGINLETEIKQLSLALHPQRPAVWIIGGAKLDKLALFKRIVNNADYVLIGGALAFSFLKAKGLPTGMSKTNAESAALAKELLDQRHADRIILPVDFRVVEKMSSRAPAKLVPFNNLQSKQIGLDIGDETIALFKEYLKKAKTIVWNGPLGYFEWSKFAKSTKELARFIGKLNVTSICGGGDTTSALQKFHLDHLMSHVSTGGGAAMAFLEGQKLVGITALERNYKIFKDKTDYKDTISPLRNN